jgi:MFS family permease
MGIEDETSRKATHPMSAADHAPVAPAPPAYDAGAASASPEAVSEWRRGWPVIVAATTGFGSSLALFTISSGLFIAPMRAEFSWTMSEAAFVPIVTLLIALMMPLCGVVIDKVGARRVALFGVLLFAAAYVALAVLPLSLGMLYAIVGCVGLLGAAGNSGPYIRIAASWFRRNAGSAFGVTLSGISVGGVIIMPLAALAMERYGWRAGYLTLAAIMLIFALPLMLWLLREAPPAAEPKAGQASDPLSGQTLRATLADARFWILMLSLGLSALPMGAFLTHLQPLLRSQHFTLPAAAGYGSLFALAIGFGRVGGGVLIDRLWDYGVATGLLVLGAIGSYFIPTLGPKDPNWAMAGAVVALGLSYGAEVNFGAYFTLKLFGLRDFSKIFGIKALVVGGGVALGGMLSSALFDMTGGYKAFSVAGAALFLLSAATLLLIAAQTASRAAR